MTEHSSSDQRQRQQAHIEQNPTRRWRRHGVTRTAVPVVSGGASRANTVPHPPLEPPTPPLPVRDPPTTVPVPVPPMPPLPPPIGDPPLQPSGQWP